MATGRPNGGIPRPPSDIDPRVRRAIDAMREIAAALDAITSLGEGGTAGILITGGDGSFQVRSLASSNAGVLVQNGNGTSGNMTISLADDVAAIEALSSTGMLARTGSNAWSLRTITGPTAGLTITNGNGVSGNPTIALADKIASLQNLSTAGSPWLPRWNSTTFEICQIIAGGALAGNQILQIDMRASPSNNIAIQAINELRALDEISASTTPGILCRTYPGRFLFARTLTGTNGITITNPTGATANPIISCSQDISTSATMTLAGVNLTGGASVGAGTLSLSDGVNVTTGTSTGTKFGTSTSQKLSFWNATPIVQPASAVQAALTDSTGGTSTGATLVNVDTAGVADVAKVNSNFAVLAALVNQLRNDMVSVGLIKGSA